MGRGVLALLLGLGLVAGAQADPFSPSALGFESVAATDDASALRVNPAGIGLRYPSEMRLGYASNVLARDLWSGSASFAWRGFGLFGERTRSDSRAYGAGFAAGSDALRLGWTGAVLAPDGQGGASVGDHTLGALSRPRPWLSLGATLAHATAPEFQGARLPREQTYAIGLRPLAWSRTAAHSAGPRWTVTADLTLREGESAESARARVGAELEPIAGLVLRASAARGEYRVGLGLFGTRMSAHASQSRIDDTRTAESYAWSGHRGEDASRFLAPSERRVATIKLAGVLADESLGGLSLLGGGSATPSAPLHRQLERALEDPLTRETV